MAQSVAQRYREIGIRMALGSDRRKVLLLILKQGFGLTLVGVVAVVCLVALGASYLPARRAATVDPLRSLRAE